MNNRFDELAKDMAKGMSRRSAVRVFLSGLGAAVTGILLGRGTAQAALPPDHKKKHKNPCEEFCEYWFGSDQELLDECLEESKECGKDTCAFTNFGVNGAESEQNWFCVNGAVTG